MVIYQEQKMMKPNRKYENFLIKELEKMNLLKYHHKQKSYRKSVPKTLKDRLWDVTFGPEIGQAECYVCSATINSKKFEAGHIIPVAHGGSTTLDNLRCICGTCNKSMGTQNLEEFKEQFFGNCQLQGKKYRNRNRNRNRNQNSQPMKDFECFKFNHHQKENQEVISEGKHEDKNDSDSEDDYDDDKRCGGERKKRKKRKFAKSNKKIWRKWKEGTIEPCQICYKEVVHAEIWHKKYCHCSICGKMVFHQKCWQKFINKMGEKFGRDFTFKRQTDCLYCISVLAEKSSTYEKYSLVKVN
jgi:hypothetical protein